MVLCQKFLFTWEMSLRIAFRRNSRFREKWVNHIMKIGHVLSQVKFYGHWN